MNFVSLNKDLVQFLHLICLFRPTQKQNLHCWHVNKMRFLPWICIKNLVRVLHLICCFTSVRKKLYCRMQISFRCNNNSLKINFLSHNFHTKCWHVFLFNFFYSICMLRPTQKLNLHCWHVNVLLLDLHKKSVRFLHLISRFNVQKSYYRHVNICVKTD